MTYLGIETQFSYGCAQQVNTKNNATALILLGEKQQEGEKLCIFHLNSYWLVVI